MIQKHSIWKVKYYYLTQTLSTSICGIYVKNRLCEVQDVGFAKLKWGTEGNFGHSSAPKNCS